MLILGGGAKSIGLYAAGSAVARGAGVVDYLETTRAQVHRRLGRRPTACAARTTKVVLDRAALGPEREAAQ